MRERSIAGYSYFIYKYLMSVWKIHESPKNIQNFKFRQIVSIVLGKVYKKNTLRKCSGDWLTRKITLIPLLNECSSIRKNSSVRVQLVFLKSYRPSRNFVWLLLWFLGRFYEKPFGMWTIDWTIRRNLIFGSVYLKFVVKVHIC